ncbi:hypothetical protein KH5H1_26270 [Corallococcus caeni]|uniref:DNA alkylation repair protein n=1 Tax=Corallococcus caeni TaxID=3082388 RepID=UPI0029569844|nr:hypothetical protein KH5H1_26270 [Corallococcus sp. KH5-1]
MRATPAVIDELRSTLKSRSDPRLAEATRRYFPTDIRALGVGNAEVRRIADALVKQRGLSPEDCLAVTEDLLAQATHHEEVLLGFAMVRKAVGRAFDESLLDRFRYWLEHTDVQKSVGWLLKVAADHHREAVVGFIQENISRMQRDTLRYAIERLAPEQRKALLALKPKMP